LLEGKSPSHAGMNLEMNIGEGIQPVEVLKFNEWFEQWQWLVLSGRDGQQHVVYQKTNGNTLNDVKY